MKDTLYDYCIGTANPALKKLVGSMLSDHGFFSTGEGKSIPEFLRTLRLTQPWLAIIDTQLPPGKIRQLAAIIEEDDLAATLYINTGNITLNGYMMLQWPVDGPVLVAVARALCLEFAHRKKLSSKIKGLEKKLIERREIEKAKGLLMKEMSLEEEDAFRYLQRISMEQRKSMIEISCRIISDRNRTSY